MNTPFLLCSPKFVDSVLRCSAISFAGSPQPVVASYHCYFIQPLFFLKYSYAKIQIDRAKL
jgi:hypothetical protein